MLLEYYLVPNLTFFDIQVHLDPNSKSYSHQYEGGINIQCNVIVVIDYRIKVQGIEDTTPSSIEFCENSGDSFVVRSATINSLSVLKSTSPVTTPMTTQEGTSDSLTAAIDIIVSPQTTTATKKYEVEINLDYNYIQTELMRVVRDTLRKMPMS